MKPPSGRHLLDTNILVHYLRQSPVSLRIESRFGLMKSQRRPLISIVTVGELLALAKRLGWGARKRDLLRILVENLVVVDLDRPSILNAYAEISAATEASGRKMGQQNDLWIAATARATEAHLVTMDKDFDRLHPRWIQRTLFEPAP